MHSTMMIRPTFGWRILLSTFVSLPPTRLLASNTTGAILFAICDEVVKDGDRAVELKCHLDTTEYESKPVPSTKARNPEGDSRSFDF
jgi:hypothetical protein